MGAMKHFEFKPALMRGRNHWTLDSGLLTRNGEPFCDLGRVIRARFAEMTVRYTHSEWLDLYFEGGRHRISCNMPSGDESNTQFRALGGAILSELAERKPDLQVAIGAGGTIRWAMFIIGLLAGVTGLVFAGAALGGGVRESKTLFATLFGGGFILFGGLLAWRYRPWAPPLLLPVKAAGDMLARLALNDQPASTE